MRILVLPFVLILITVSSYAQIIVSSCNAPDSIVKLYRTDADRLSLRRAYQTGSGYKDSISINRVESNNSLKGLLAVYNATSLPVNDTIVRILNIHTLLAGWDMNFISVSADSNLVWMQEIRNNTIPNSNPIVNSLIQKYYLQKTNYISFHFNSYHTVFFKADSNFNILPLTLKFKSITGVVYSDPNTSGLDGPDIIDSIGPNYTKIWYAYKWSDCMIGCYYTHWWEFKVYNDCSVEYLGSFGDQLPANVGIKENSLTDFNIYPNPTSQYLNVDSGNEPKSITIVNAMGQSVFMTQIDGKKKLDVGFLNSGLYFLNVTNGFNKRTFKILKQ